MSEVRGEMAHMLTDQEKALRERLSGEDWMIVKAGFQRSYAAGCSDERALRSRVEALIGGPTPPIFLSDRPNKIIRVQHRDDRFAATVTESMVRVSDIVAALDAVSPPAQPTQPTQPETTP